MIHYNRWRREAIFILKIKHEKFVVLSRKHGVSSSLCRSLRRRIFLQFWFFSPLLTWKIDSEVVVMQERSLFEEVAQKICHYFLEEKSWEMMIRTKFQEMNEWMRHASPSPAAVERKTLHDDAGLCLRRKRLLLQYSICEGVQEPAIQEETREASLAAAVTESEQLPLVQLLLRCSSDFKATTSQAERDRQTDRQTRASNLLFHRLLKDTLILFWFDQSRADYSYRTHLSLSLRRISSWLERDLLPLHSSPAALLL